MLHLWALLVWAGSGQAGPPVVIVPVRLHYPAADRVHRVPDPERTRAPGAAPRTHFPST